MVLVTGATGILGRVIALKLLEKGFNVKATKRPSSNLNDVKHSGMPIQIKPKSILIKLNG
jgi:nucleoside-diphosphate-sugar epimerase